MKQVRTLLGKYGFVVHPLLFALFPLLSFYGANQAELRSHDFEFGTFLLLNFMVAIVAWVLAWLVTHSTQKASILTTAFLTVFFTFGRAHSSLQDTVVNTPFGPMGPTKILLLLSAVFLASVWFGLKRLPVKTLQNTTSGLVLIACVMVASTLITIIPRQFAGSSSSGTNLNTTTQIEEDPQVDKQNLPDIYYILLDGYARADFLKVNFELDNSEFIDSLKAKGFYVADKANSNYAHTHFSVPSTLNMKYLNYLANEMGEESTDRQPLRQLLDNNEVVSAFKSLGYQYIQIGSQWGWTMKSPLADIDIPAESNADSKILNIELDEFALVYLQTTALKPWISTNIRHTLLARILGAFERTEKVVDREEPTLAFTHIVSPHPPYLFDRNGIIEGQTPLDLDNHGFSDRDKFAEQTRYVNKRILDLVDKIQKDSGQPPIIIIASDHGPASGLGRKDLMETDPTKFNVEGVRERMGIINAYYFPDQNYDQLYPSITPVNSFRLILGQYFDVGIELLPDRSYFSDNKTNEYRMFDVTKLVK